MAFLFWLQCSCCMLQRQAVVGIISYIYHISLGFPASSYSRLWFLSRLATIASCFFSRQRQRICSQNDIPASDSRLIDRTRRCSWAQTRQSFRIPASQTITLHRPLYRPVWQSGPRCSSEVDLWALWRCTRPDRGPPNALIWPKQEFAMHESCATICRLWSNMALDCP